MTGPDQDAERATVTVVVPTRNNIRTIEACLRSVVEQTHRGVELVVVDNHSTDGTPQVAERFADRVITAGPERSVQRNTGIEAAGSEWVLWLDSDMILPPRTIALALDTARATGATGIALPERTIGDGFWTACRALERECYLDDPWLHNPRLVRRDYLLGDGAFHPDMSGPEDADLRMKMRSSGAGIELAPIIIDHDEGRLTVRDVMSKRYYYGRSIPAFAEQHEGAVGAQGKAVLRSYLRNHRRLLGDPAHAIGMVALRAMEAGGYAMGARRGRKDRTTP
ncbi:glycosyl transferase family 2 [Janibacter sp. Soil728]|uniref:glycosyltransferase family 2 protein n=1 Tax=Janibacter sp. Soil728 TaxID=1736393 RepID=UPI0006F3899F|nr:glycosyltransferase family A protein [Janibacter sp. Soil728]KRE37164.1 glycosyl transferase family 2 [Janibacter sp. Soil728]